MLRLLLFIGIISQLLLACFPKEQVLDKNMVQSSSCLKSVMQVDPTMTYLGSYSKNENHKAPSGAPRVSIICNYHVFSNTSESNKVYRFVIVRNARITDHNIIFAVPDDYFSNITKYLDKGKIELGGDYYQYCTTIQAIGREWADFFKSKSYEMHKYYVVKYFEQWCNEKTYMTIIYGEHPYIKENDKSGASKLKAFLSDFNQRSQNSISFVSNVN